jgi:hypothetical protein
MSKIKTVCWGLLATISVGFLEPVIAIAAPGDKPPSAPSTVPAPAAPPVTVPAAPMIPLPKDITLATVFSGSIVPTSVRLRDLTPDWRCMATNGAVEFGNLQSVLNTSAGGSFAASYYTRGQTITVGSETYIVAYSLLTVVDKITPDTPLSLSLLNLRTVGSLSNIRNFDVAKETKVLEKQLAIYKLANVFDPTLGTPQENRPIESVPAPNPEEVVPPAPKKPIKKRPRNNRRRR